MSDKTLYMRIGSDKAGTVSLSKLVTRNKNIFLKHGMYAPIRNCFPLYDYFVKKENLTSIDIFDPVNIIKNEVNRIELQDQFSQFIATYDEYKDYDIFLTTETFWGKFTKKNIPNYRKEITALCGFIRDFFKNHKIIVIINLRRIDLYIESLFKQAVKGGSVPNIQLIAGRLKPDKSEKLLELLEKSFGRNNIIIRPFERSQMVNSDFISDILRIMDLDEFISEFEIKVENEGLHRDLCETLFIVNETYGKVLPNKDLLRLSYILKNEYKLPDVKYILSSEERTNLISKYDPFYQYLSETYNSGRPFFSEPLPSDDHLSYTLPKDRFEMIKQLIFELKDKK